jgi:D-lactate dehydrogenase
LLEKLLTIIPESRVRSKFIDRVSFASDAGFYYLLPKAIVQPDSEAEIISLFQFSRAENIPLVFRGGGTSLSGQSITDGILVDLSRFWNKVKVESNGETVRVQPGITGAMVNAHLKKYRRKIGPDPSSINSAMMGGILSNNSSGMCCGVVLNSYHTTKYIRFVLPDGKTFSTELPDDYRRFERECYPLFTALTELKAEITADAELLQKIRSKYRMKTTIGYSLNAFVDFAHPLDILAHLLIGAEGTLAFISEAVLNTVPDYLFKSTGLLYFDDIYSACQAIVPLTRAGAMMVELMDRASLQAVQDLPGMPSVVKTLTKTASALLIEFQENTIGDLEKRVNLFLEASRSLSLLYSPEFSTDPKQQDFFWKVRKGLFPAVGAVRASGTTVILEDIAFPVPQLGDAILDLQELFKKYHYDNAIIFGHAKDGNIHFVVTQAFHTTAEIERYDRFMRDVVDLVINKYNGTLKAEHGTGRNMAPFVETEWGGKAYDIIRRIKIAVDPALLLNPGVIVNPDKEVHIKNLKALPSVEEEVDRCIECGYCEHKCPSRDLTTTPRRRIVVRRVLKDLEQKGDTRSYDLLLSQYQYDGIDTCAVDGLCATACPVDINTGDLVKRLRNENHSALANTLALLVAKNFGFAQGVTRFALRSGIFVNSVFGRNTMSSITRGLRKMIPALPLWSNRLLGPPALKELGRKPLDSTRRIVYYPACISRLTGTYSGRDKNLLETFMSVCTKSGIQVVVPKGVHSTCCSQIFSSKGFGPAQQFAANKVLDLLWAASEGGAIPIVTDVSSCAYTLHKLEPALNTENKLRWQQLKIMDSIDFVYEQVIPLAQGRPKGKKIVLHPVCSLTKMKTEDRFLAIANSFATEVTVPKSAGCCGMAGDRGFILPELTASATHDEASEVRLQEYDGYYSSTKTCELAMSEAVQQNYESILYLVDEAL